ncbi:CDP-glycerol glycerophosphotransferase family protein, partial [Candidatus Sumerlaeota bacterium]|nr:CDP-glycerol glycerophosphotransferase family protein [Candidatus Sumerlaeota bacterium]
PAMVNETLFKEFDADPSQFHKTSSHDQYPYDVFVTSNNSSLLRPPNSKKSVQMFHGVSFRNFAVNPDYLTFDKLFFPGRYMMEQYIARGYLTEGDPRIELMGMPKLDRLVDGTIRREDVLRHLGLDPAVPTVLWCPTGARHNSYELLGREGLKAIQATGYNLIVKLHDHPHLPKGVTREELLRHTREGLGERGRLEDHSDVAPLLVAADLLISDASSVAYEYCILDRPIIFVDVPELLAERAAMDGSNIDPDTHGRKVGKIVGGANELKEAIVDSLAHPETHSAERRATRDHIFHQPGNAAKRMAARLKELAGAAAG